MPKIHRFIPPELPSGLSGTEKVPLVPPGDLARHAPDAHLVLAEDSGEAAARCSLWWSSVPDYPERRLGFVGHYAARDDDAALKLLRHACAELAAQGCTLAVGPLDGTTWRRYRFVVERGEELPFFLEPDNPDDWPLHFTSAGFREFASYSSFLNTDLGYVDPRIEGAAERMRREGIVIREIDMDRFDRELEAIFELSLAGFADNFLYSPITREEFSGMYEKVRPFISPGLTLLAEREGQTVGFLFTIPDILRAQRGEPSDTVVLKSIAVLPGKRQGGLGNLLMARSIEAARRMGYRRAVHALVHESNNSYNMCIRYASPMRRYALFCRELG